MKLITIVLFFIWVLPGSAVAQRERGKAVPGSTVKKSTPSVLAKQHFKTYAEQINLKGKVKSIHEVTYFAFEKDGQIVKGDTADSPSLTTFDLAGNRISAQLLNSDGSIDEVYEYKFAKPGMLTESKIYYHSNSKLIEKNVYQYNQDDYRDKWTKYDSLENVSTQSTYKYSFNHMSNEYTATLDSFYYRDSRTKELVGIYSGDYDEFVIDDNANILSMKTKVLESFSLSTFKLNADGQVIFETYQDKMLQDGTFEDTAFTISYEYDSNGNAIKEIATGNTLTRYIEYTYDLQGNWTKRILHNIDPDPVYGESTYVIAERKIDYF